MIGKKKNASLEATQNKHIHIEILVAFIVAVVTLFLPYVGYTYKSQKYTLSGLSMLTGKTICGGNLVLSVSIPMVLLVIAMVAILISAFLDYVKNENASYRIATLASIIIVVVNIYFSTSVAGKLSTAKKVAISYGSLICLIVAFTLMIWGMYRLWKNKVLSSLDFMAVPGMLYFVVNNYIPMFGIAIAFKKIDYSKGIWASPWVGFSNFKQLFASNTDFFASDAWRITRNTLLYNAVFIILGTIVGILVGICLADIFSRGLQKFFQTSILLPQLISYVIVTYIVYGFFSNDAGFVNHLLKTNINFYAEAKYWPFVLVFVYIWKIVGYNAIIYLSSIVGIDHSIYEAAKVDGCNKWKQIHYITIPLLKPTVVTLFMLSIGRIMYSDFGLFYQVTKDSGALYPVTDTIDTYVYRCLMTLNNISTSSAACTYQAIIGFALVLVVNMVVRKRDKENAMF
jgi:ABC-type polysaccharide transport system permease subunit